MGVYTNIISTDTILNRNSVTDCFNVGIISARTAIFLPLFILASGVQNDVHRYLASLPKYTLPVLPVFQYIVCPHYTMECLIYLSMAFLAAPADKWINGTLLTVVIFVVINLGIVANSTREWSIQKFGADSMAKRWRMIPGVW